MFITSHFVKLLWTKQFVFVFFSSKFHFAHEHGSKQQIEQKQGIICFNNSKQWLSIVKNKLLCNETKALQFFYINISHRNIFK